MKITCPHCGVTGFAHDSMPGKKVRCPQCEKVFIIMEQKIVCPHCLVIGTAHGSPAGTKLRCPQCEKVFLLTRELIAAGTTLAQIPAPMAETEAMAAPIIAQEVPSGLAMQAEPAMEAVEESVPVITDEFKVEPEPVVAPVAILVEEESVVEVAEEPAIEEEPEGVPEVVIEPEVLSEVEPIVEVAKESAIEEEPEGVPEVMVEPEVLSEAEPVVEEALEHEPEKETKAEAEPIIIPEPVSVVPSVQAVAHEALPKSEPKKKDSVSDLTTKELPSQVCAGCGGSFHPKYLQEVDAKPMCGVCQLRLATAEEKTQTTQASGQKVRGALTAIALLGALALALFILKKMGIL